jgi:hypothetical protein
MHSALLAVAAAAATTTTNKLSVGEEAYLPHEMGRYNGPFLYSLHLAFELSWTVSTLRVAGNDDCQFCRIG